MSRNTNKMSSVVGRDVRKNHKDYNQVVLDVRRSMKRFPKGVCACVCMRVCVFVCLCVLAKDSSRAQRAIYQTVPSYLQQHAAIL